MRILSVLAVSLMVLLTFTFAPSSVQADDLMVKLKKGTGLTFQTADKNYKLRMRLRGQFLANYTNKDGDDDDGLGFRVRRLRITWDGNAFAPWMKYKIQYDFSRDGELKDLKLSFARNKMFVPVAGQYKVPFNREVLNSSSALQLVGRSIITDYFEFDRDIGGGIYGLLGDGMVRYDLGIFQGEGANTKNDKGDMGMLWSARIQASVMGESAEKVKENFGKEPTLTIGAAVAGIDVKDDGKDDPSRLDSNVGIPSEERALVNGSVISFTADANYRDPRFNLTGEYIGRWVDDDALKKAYDYGFRAQGGFFLMPKKFEVAARYAQISFDEDVPAEDNMDKIWAAAGGVNYYLSGNHKWKVQIDYTFQKQEMIDGTEADESMVRAQVQAYF